MGACKSFQEHARVCSDGFVQLPLCGGRAGCPTCGHIGPRAVPYCERDEVPEHFVTETGAPRFYSTSES